MQIAVCACGVESIRAMLSHLGAKIAPTTYEEHRNRQATAREQRDQALTVPIAAVYASNYGVFGARKVWWTLNRERAAAAAPIARCTVERLEGEPGLHTAVRGKAWTTSRSPPLNGSTGSTTAGPTSTATTSHPCRPNRPTTLTTRPWQPPESQTCKSPDSPGRFSWGRSLFSQRMYTSRAADGWGHSAQPGHSFNGINGTVCHCHAA